VTGGVDTSVVVWTSGSSPSVSGTGAGVGSTTGGGVGSGAGAGGASTAGALTSPSWANAGEAGSMTREKINKNELILYKFFTPLDKFIIIFYYFSALLSNGVNIHIEPVVLLSFDLIK
jgi:hypothetical protein